MNEQQLKLRARLKEMRKTRTGETYREAVRSATGAKKVKIPLHEAKAAMLNMGLDVQQVEELLDKRCDQERRNEIMRQFYSKSARPARGNASTLRPELLPPLV